MMERRAFSRPNIPPCLQFCMSSCKQRPCSPINFYGFAYVGSCEVNIALKIEGVGSCGSTSLHTLMTKLPST